MDPGKVQKMKIVQLNIWYGKLGSAAIRFLNQQKPDIVCLQEASEIEGPTGGMFVPLHAIQEETGLAEARFAPTASYRFMTRKCQYGNAILSKFPLEHEKIIFVHGQYNDDYDRAEGDYNNPTCKSVRPNCPVKPLLSSIITASISPIPKATSNLCKPWKK